MAADLAEKTDRYEELLATALEAVETTPSTGTVLADAAADFLAMAQSYHEDGQHFLDEADPVNALAAFSYGHAWLDAGARLGLFDVSDDVGPFAV